MRLNLNTLSWRIMECKHKAAIRKQLLAAVKRVAPSVTRLSIKFQLDYATKLSLAALLAPLAPHVQVTAGTAEEGAKEASSAAGSCLHSTTNFCGCSCARLAANPPCPA